MADRLSLLLPELTTFIDSDDLYDLRSLLEDVKQSGVLVLLQSSGVLTRPWCLLESECDTAPATSQPMWFKRSLHVSTYWLLQRQGSAIRTMMKPGSMMNLVRGGLRSRGEG